MQETAWKRLQLFEITFTFLLSDALNCLCTQPTHSYLPNLLIQSPLSLVHFGEFFLSPQAKNLMFHTGYTHGFLTPKKKQRCYVLNYK